MHYENEPKFDQKVFIFIFKMEHFKNKLKNYLFCCQTVLIPKPKLQNFYNFAQKKRQNLESFDFSSFLWSF